MHRRASVGSIGFLAGCLVACSSSVGHVSVRRRSAQTITVRVAGNCPPTLGAAQDVAKQPGMPSNHLLPTEPPSSGLICEYTASADGITPLLRQKVRLSSVDARKLAIAIGRVSLEPPSGEFSCPADL